MKTRQLLLVLTGWNLCCICITGALAQGNYLAGEGAGASTTGTNNTFVGNFSGNQNTSGEANTFLGAAAGYWNHIGNRNTYLGDHAGLFSYVASNNTFVGFYAGAGYNTQTNGDNAFLGYRAGYNNRGADNVFVGSNGGFSNGTGNSNSFLGKDAGLLNDSGTSNTFVGRGAAYRNTTGSYNVALGRDAGKSNNIGNGNTYLGYFSTAPTSLGNLNNATAIGYRSYVMASNCLVLGSINGLNGATANTNVGIGIPAPVYQLQLSTNSAAKPGSSSWTVASDERLKKEVRQFTDGMEVLKQVRPVWFRYNGEAGMPTEKQYVGVIAQQMKQIAPYMIGQFTYRDSLGKQSTYLDYDPSALTYVLVNAVQQHELELQQKEVQIQNQQQQIDQLAGELDAIKALLLKQPSVVPAAEGEAAHLWQNEPNPTDGTTLIRYRIPLSTKSAQIKLFSAHGQELQSYELSQRGESQLRIAVGSLVPGTYLYRLLVDGRSIDTRKLVTVK